MVLQITFEGRGGRKEERVLKHPFQNIFFLLGIEKAPYNPLFSPATSELFIEGKYQRFVYFPKGASWVRMIQGATLFVRLRGS